MHVSLLYPVLALVCAATAILLAGRMKQVPSTILCAAAAGALGISLINMTLFSLPPDHIAVSPPEGEIAVVGRITGPLEKTNSGWRFVLAVAGIETGPGKVEKVKGKVRLSIGDNEPDRELLEQLTYGAWVRVETVLAQVSGFHNAGGYDGKTALAGKGIFLTGSVSYTEFITVLQPGPDYHPVALIFCLRNHILKLLDTYAVPVHAGFLARFDVEAETVRTLSRALLVGDRTELQESLKLNFQEAGLMHLLAISGLHIGIIAWLFSSLFRFLPAGLRTRSAAVMILITLYGIVTGATPSVMRAVLIIDIYLLGKCLNRSVDLLNVLGCSAAILMVINPATVFNISFQLTFTATLGIVLLMKPIENLLAWVPSRWVRQVMAVSLAAQFATAPLTAVNFHRIGGWSFLPYIFLIPVVTGALTLGIAGLCLSPVPYLGAWLLQLHGWCIAALAAAADFMATLPGVTCRVITPGIGTLGLALTFLALLALWPRYRQLVWVWPVALFLTLGAYSNGNGKLNPGELSICFFDVGNADATLVSLPSGEHILVDAGGIFNSDFDVGRNVVAPALRTMGVQNLACIAVTHPHPDHHLGVFSIIREFSVGELWVPSRISKNPVHGKLLDLATEIGIPVREMDCSPDLNYLTLDANNRSLILGIEYGAFRCILPGDAEHEAETGLLDYGSALNSDVLKAGHHGSRTSSSPAFLNRVCPALILIPCGRNNQFGHPHRVTLNNMEALIPEPVILQSDTSGMTRVITDGRTWSVTTTYTDI